MDNPLPAESESLARSWLQYDAPMLRTYLVSGVEDPRINVQSILTRHFLFVALFGKRFEQLQEQELRFAVVMNWARQAWKKLTGPEDLRALRHALETGADNAEGLPVPPLVPTAFAALPLEVAGLTIPNYVRQLLDEEPDPDQALELSPRALATFESIWHNALREEVPAGVSVVEPACGSANDYRFFHSFGLAQLIDYSGFDLCETNITNAKTMFPQTPFAVGNVFAVPFADRSFDFCVVHDLFEHLSLEGMDLALAEVCRVTGQGLCLGLFNAYEGDEHVARPVDDYHWNTLSIPQLQKRLEQSGFEVQVIHLDTFLKWRFGFAETHNKNAYTIVAARK